MSNPREEVEAVIAEMHQQPAGSLIRRWADRLDAARSTQPEEGAFRALLEALESKRPLVWSGETLCVFEVDVPDSELWRAQASMVLDKDDFAELQRVSAAPSTRPEGDLQLTPDEARELFSMWLAHGMHPPEIDPAHPLVMGAMKLGQLQPDDVPERVEEVEVVAEALVEALTDLARHDAADVAYNHVVGGLGAPRAVGDLLARRAIEALNTARSTQPTEPSAVEYLAGAFALHQHGTDDPQLITDVHRVVARFNLRRQMLYRMRARAGWPRLRA